MLGGFAVSTIPDPRDAMATSHKQEPAAPVLLQWRDHEDHSLRRRQERRKEIAGVKKDIRDLCRELRSQ